MPSEGVRFWQNVQVIHQRFRAFARGQGFERAGAASGAVSWGTLNPAHVSAGSALYKLLFQKSAECEIPLCIAGTVIVDI